MTGFYDSPVGGSAALAGQGIDMIPATTGEVLGAAAVGGFEHAFPSWETARSEYEQGIPMDAGEAIGRTLAGAPVTGWAPGDGVLSGEAATEKYGIPGRLKWDAPVPESVARDQAARVHDDIVRQDTIARREGGFMTGGLMRFAAGLAGGLPGLIDPLNATMSFLPVVPEARAAIWAARGGLAGRAATGAIEGAAGQAALLPYQAMLTRQEGGDIDATDALLNIALGGMFGGGLHMLVGRGMGAIGERTAAAVDAAAPEAREGMLRGALSDLAEDRPVETPAAVARASEPAAVSPADTSSADISTGDISTAATSRLSAYDRVPEEPQRLAAFLKEQGGLRDEGGELASRDMGRSRPGLVSKGGMSLDDATLAAWEAGYLPGAERPPINELLDHLDRDIGGDPVYSQRDQFQAGAFQDALARNAEIDGLGREYGIDPRGLSQDEFYDRLAEHDQDAAERSRDALGADHDALMRQADAEGWLPDFGEGSPTTPEEVADAYRQERARRLADARAYGLADPELAGTGARDLEAGARQGGRGLDARRRADETEGERPRELDEGADPARLAEETAALEADVKAAGLGDSAEAKAAGDEVADAEALARACEQSGLCLGRRG